MLQLMIPENVPEGEFWDENSGQFIYVKRQIIQLEHSLISLHKWESNWKKAFLSKEDRTFEETIDYIKCMTMTQNVNPLVYNLITNEQIKQVNDYISDKKTATRIKKDKTARASRQTVTAELIYYWMILYNIPFECRKWHLSQLLTLIDVCRAESSPKKDRNKKDIASEYRALNAARRQQLGTRG